MNPLLAIPSALVLALLIAHSFRALPRRRAAAFWGSVAIFGWVRGLAVEAVAVRALGGAMPYRMAPGGVRLGSVSVQEIAGWAIVSYLAWWFGDRFARRSRSEPPALAFEIIFAMLFLGAISWSIESAAVAAGWWHWTIPARQPSLLGVPFIGIVDWALVSIDFLFPFVAITGNAPSRWRYGALLFFPVHFGVHLIRNDWPRELSASLFDLGHWLLLATLVWLAARNRGEEVEAFRKDDRWDRLPWLAAGVVIADVVAVDLFVSHAPSLAIATLPAIVLIGFAWRPALAPPAALLSGMTALFIPPAVWTAVASACASAMLAMRRRRGVYAVMLVCSIAAFGLIASVQSRASDLKLRSQLDAALAARNRGSIDEAAIRLERAASEHPESHVPAALLAEIRYREGRLNEAKALYRQAVQTKPDLVDAWRHLAVIELRNGSSSAAAEPARAALRYRPNDPEARYLLARSGARGSGLPVAGTPAEAGALAALAYEVGDAAGCAAYLDNAMLRWPGERRLYLRRVNLALAAHDIDTARRVADLWLRNLPTDPDAAALHARLR